MAKNPYAMQPKQMAFSMSSPYSHTVSAVAGQSSLDDEDDNDICPVCDGECTCSNNVSRAAPPPQLPTGPLSMEELSRQYKVVTSSSTPTFQQRPPLHQHPVPKPSLKIKFTVPQSLLAKRRTHSGGESTPHLNQYSNADETMYAKGSDEEPVAGPSNMVRSPPLYQYPVKPPPKKRGRPRKADIASGRDLSVDSIASRRPSTSPVRRRVNPKTPIVGRPKQSMYATKIAQTIKKRPPPPKKRTKKGSAGPKRRRPAYMDSDASSESSLSDDDMFGPSRAYEADNGGDVQFPTFVSASALSSMESDNGNSDSSLSDFSDSDMEKEEEEYIVSEMQQRARVNRELLGDNARKTSQNNEWVIRPRKKSVGLSDAELDSDATEDEDEEEAQVQEADEEDEDETDEKSTGGRGLVTGWSDDEESSFDADLFFANLSSTSDSDSSSDESMRQHGLNDGDDDTVSDASTEAGLAHMREELENLPLELTESWDGHLVFTNGMHNRGGGIIDIDFERDASQFIPAESPCCSDAVSPTPDEHMANDESDIEMSNIGSDGDDGYEEDGGEGEGDTTDEELVGDDDLPNERAMRLFNFPLSVNAINPLSTVSPMVTPAKRGRFGSLVPPTPQDILSGRVFWDSDEMDELFDQGHRRSFSSSSKGSGAGPRQGVFVVVQESRQAIIDGSHTAIPSPHPRFNRNRRGRRLNAIEALLKKHFSSMRNEPSFVPVSPVVPDHAPLRLLPSVEIAASAGTSALAEGSGHDGLTTPIDLDDVLDAAFLHPDPSESSQTGDASNGDGPPESTTTADESDSNQKELKHLHRWDVISVAAFRQTRENAGIMDSPGAPGWTPGSRRTPASSADYGNIMKASPFSTMLWPTGHNKSKRSSKRDREAVAQALTASPLMDPTQGDGDSTPTKNNNGGNQHQQYDYKYARKSKKELKKEQKLKRKNFGPHAHHHSHHHSHHHHPNSKARSMGSMQRNNFLSSVPPLNL